MTLVSIITPTENRDALLPLIHKCVIAQDWPEIEWLIGDSSPKPSLYITSQSDPRIRYFHQQPGVSLGMKRNHLVDMANGEFIAHFDDDDFYTPGYITTMMHNAWNRQVEFVKITSFYLMHGPSATYAYWDLRRTVGLHFAWSRGRLTSKWLTEEDNENLSMAYLGYGFSYVYSKCLWREAPFPDLTWNEDGIFARGICARHPYLLIDDHEGIVVHLLHDRNSSRSFPQYIFPRFLLPKLLADSLPVLEEMQHLSLLSQAEAMPPRRLFT
jgi:glycosyltransferase involved in cell wall biosynthesis